MDAKKMSNGITIGLVVVGAFLIALISFMVYKVVGLFIAGSLLDASTSSGFDTSITEAMNTSVQTYVTQIALLDSPVTIMATLIIVVVIIGIFAFLWMKNSKGKKGGSDMGY